MHASACFRMSLQKPYLGVNILPLRFVFFEKKVTGITCWHGLISRDDQFQGGSILILKPDISPFGPETQLKREL